MKIIINPQLRKLRTYLNQKHIKYQDFMLNKTILKFSFSQQTYLISCLQNLDITKEQFSFLLNVFENSNTLFYKILDLIRKGVVFGPKEVELYYENKEIYEILVNIKQKNSNIDCLSQTFIDTWGKDVICKNYNIMPLYNLDELKKYINIIQKNPTILRDIQPLLNSADDKKYIDRIINLSSKIDIKEFISVFVKLKEHALREYFIENPTDIELKTFISNFSGEIPSGIPCYTFIQDLMKKAKVSYDFSKKLLYYKLLEIDDLLHIEAGAYQILFNTSSDNVRKAYLLATEAISNDYPIPDNLKYLYEFYAATEKHSMSKDEIMEKIHESIYNSSQSFNFDEVFTWAKNFKSWQISKNIINPQKESINRYEEYSYYDENNNLVKEQIPIIKIDNPNFEALVHCIYKKDKDTSLHYELTEKLVDNPKLWETTTTGNPNISMSYIWKLVKTFGESNGVLLGFSSISPERLEGTFVRDAATPTNRLADDESLAFCEHENLKRLYEAYGSKQFYDYNEILTKRYCDGKVNKPDFVIVVSGTDDMRSIDTAKKWAAYFKIPIVEIDGKKLREYHFSEYHRILDSIKQKHYIDDFSVVQKLYDEITLIKGFSKLYDYNVPTIFEAFYELTQNIDLDNFENMQIISQLLKEIKKRNPQHWFYCGYSLCKFNKNNKYDYEDPRVTDEKLEQIREYADFIENKCKEVLKTNDLNFSQEENKLL